MFLTFLAAFRSFNTRKTRAEIDTFDGIYPYLVAVNQILDLNYTLTDFVKLEIPELPEESIKALLEGIKQTALSFGELSFNDFINIITEGQVSFDEECAALSIYLEEALFKNTPIYPTFVEMKEGILFQLDILEGFIRALNLDPETIKKGILYMYDHNQTITIGESLTQLGFNYHDLFQMYDKLVKLIKKDSKYSLIQFVKDLFYKPPSDIPDKFYNAVKAILVDGKFTFKALEEVLFTFIKLISYSIQSFFLFLIDLTTSMFKPIENIFDLKSKDVKTRINDAMTSIDKLISLDPTSEEFKQMKENLTNFAGNGLNLRDMYNSPEFDLSMITVGSLANPKKSLFSVIANDFFFTDIGRVFKCILDITKTLLDDIGKFSAIQESIDQLPEDFFGYELKSNVSLIFQAFMEIFPNEITNNKIVELSFIDPVGASAFLNETLEMARAFHETLSFNLCFIFQIPEEEFIEMCTTITYFSKGDQDAFETLSTLLLMSQFASVENCTYFTNTVKRVLSSVSTSFSHLNEHSTYPFTQIFGPISEYSQKFSELLSKDNVPLKDLIQLIAPKYTALLDAVYATFNGIISDMKVEEFLKRIPPNFLDALATIDNLCKLMDKGVSAKTITLPQLSEAITSQNALRTNFEDLFPLKHVVFTAKALSSTPVQSMTTKNFVEALQVDPAEFKSAISSFNNVITSENGSFTNMVQTYTEYNMTKSFSSVSNMADKIMKDELVNAAQFEIVVNELVEDAKQKSGPTQSPAPAPPTQSQSPAPVPPTQSHAPVPPTQSQSHAPVPPSKSQSHAPVPPTQSPAPVPPSKSSSQAPVTPTKSATPIQPITSKPSVTPEPIITPDSSESKSKLSTGGIVGISITCIVIVVVAIVAFIVFKMKKSHNYESISDKSLMLT